MATTTLKLWSEGPEIDQCGPEIGGIRIGWAEIQLAENRAEAIEMGVTAALCDDYEQQGGTYRAGSLRDWLDDRATEAQALLVEIDAIDAPDLRP